MSDLNSYQRKAEEALSDFFDAIRADAIAYERERITNIVATELKDHITDELLLKLIKGAAK